MAVTDRLRFELPDCEAGAGPAHDGDAARWAHTCAWDGHELGNLDYVEISPHERVCPLHHPEFVAWLRDKSKTMYRVVSEEEVLHAANGEKRPSKMLRFLPMRSRARSSTLGGARGSGRKPRRR